MKISLDWLKQYIKIDLNSNQICADLTSTGLEVEGLEVFEKIKGGLKGLVLGHVLSCSKHPDAEKLKLTKVDVGQDEPLSIVCGAPNVAEGQKVVVATIGTILYTPEGEEFKIKKSKIRGELSQGMICAEDELGLGESHDGIMVLDTDKKVGTPASEVFNIQNDEIIEIGLTPNRADAISHTGVARDLKALYGAELLWPSVDNFKVDSTDLPITVEVKNTEACPRYSGLTIKGVKVAESPDWLQFRLKSIGLLPINNIVDITNFVLHELGQPLHAFDYNQIKNNTVIVQNVAEAHPFVTLDDKERKLSAEDLMICDGEGKPMCIAGVFGGATSGVTEETTDIFLESAYFSAKHVRKTAQTHTLKTDASFRYERGTDPNILIYALKRAALLITEIAGGSISSEIVDIYPEPIRDFEIKVKYKNIDRLIGEKLGKDFIKTTLNRLDIQLIDLNEDGFKAIVPPYRVDVTREADVIEEILRIYGYDNVKIEENLQSGYLSSFPEINSYKKERSVATLLSNNGFNEVMTNSLTSSKYTQHLKELEATGNVLIMNKLSEDLDVMRQTLLFNHLEVAAHNINRKQKSLKLYEFGKTYKTINGRYTEAKRLGILLSGPKENENWINPTQEVTYYDLKVEVYKIFDKFRLAEKLKFQKTKYSAFAYGLDVFIKKDFLATVGLLKSNVTQVLGIKQQIFYASIDWDLLLLNSLSKISYEEISKYPEVRRDLSLVVDKAVSFEQIQQVAIKYSSNLLKDINAFDVYVGDKIDENKKAYALSFILADKNKTLTEKLIDKTMKKFIHAFQNELDAVIRQ